MEEEVTLVKQDGIIKNKLKVNVNNLEELLGALQGHKGRDVLNLLTENRRLNQGK